MRVGYVTPSLLEVAREDFFSMIHFIDNSFDDDIPDSPQIVAYKCLHYILNSLTLDEMVHDTLGYIALILQLSDNVNVLCMKIVIMG
jgi:hypothetical protein